MKKLSILLTPAVLGTFVLASCSSSNLATSGADDNMYFMASDAKLSTEYAVQNNNPETFQEFNSLNNVPDESFSSRNVNPDYISRYQSETTETGDDVVYFDESSEVVDGEPDIDVYNNYYVGTSGNNSSWLTPSFAFNMGFMYGFNPWGFGYYDPFYGPSWGFRPGFSMNIGFGWGSGFGFGNPYFRPGFGWGGYYPSYAWGGGYYPGYGYPGLYPGNPIYVLPGGEYGDRRVVRGNRPTRGASLASAGSRAATVATLPSTARAQARRDVMNNRSIVSNDRARTSSRDFGTSQNDYYNSSRSRIATTRNSRNSGSAAMTRSSNVRSRSAMPTARPSTRALSNRSGINTRSIDNYRRSTSNPSYRRTTAPSYNRNTINRSTNPTYNRSTPNTRTYTPARSSSGSRMSAPVRSSSGGGSRGSTSSGSRGGRGN